MTEAGGGGPAPGMADGEGEGDAVAAAAGESGSSALSDSLDQFKAGRDLADESDVSEAGTRSRLNWDPVTDSNEPDGRRDEASFRFDLGGALARFGDGEPSPADPAVDGDVDPLPVRERPVAADPLPVRERPVTPDPLPVRERAATIDPLPVRERVEAADPLPVPERLDETRTFEPTTDVRGDANPGVNLGESPSGSAPPGRSTVFDPVPGAIDPAALASAPSPSLPVQSPTLPTQAPAAAAPTLPTQAPAAAAPTLPTQAPAAAAPTLPSLPSAAPPAPAYVPPVSDAPSTPTVNALRSAQIRAAQQQKKRSGKSLGRSLFVFVGTVAVIAAAVYFGRGLLFTTEWDPTLTPIVDRIQSERAVEFERTVELVTQAPADYAATIGGLGLDGDWQARVREWRALGLATGDPTAEVVGAALASLRPAVYDPDADRIYLLEGTAAEDAAPHLRLALEQALTAQVGGPGPTPDATSAGFAGVSAMDEIARKAVEAYVADRQETAPLDGSTATTVPDAAAAPDGSASAPAEPDLSTLPLPIAYELMAIDRLGESLLRASGTDPQSYTSSSPPPAALATILDDRSVATQPAVLGPDDKPLAEPGAVGLDDWWLVWSTRLPEATVSELSRLVVAENYVPFDRAGVTCFSAVFATTDTASGLVVTQALLQWAAGAPTEAQTSVTAIGETSVQLVSCDPGPGVAFELSTTAVTSLLNTQLARLAARPLG